MNVNWLNLRYAWTLWLVYGGLWLYCWAHRKEIVRGVVAQNIPMKFRIVKGIAIATSVSLIIIYPLVCLVWLVVGITAYPTYCMIREREWHPVRAMVAKATRDAMKMNWSC